MLCSDFQIVKEHHGGEDVLPLPCNCWTCDYCAPRRKRKLVAIARSGNPNKILTITVNTAVGLSPFHRRQMLHTAWKALTKRIMRQFKWKKLHYMAFVEKTKRGEPHLHILLRCGYIPQAWLSTQLKDLIGSPIVWIEQVKNTQQAVFYVTKYVGKAPAQFGTLKRYWVSREWSQEPVPEPRVPIFDRNTMFIRREPYSDQMNQRISQGWTMEETSEGWHLWHRPGQKSWKECKEAERRWRDVPSGADSRPEIPPDTA